MPRHESPRSPLGSTSSKRSHRDDDRYERSRKEDFRSHRHRSRTRSPDKHYRDRDYRAHRDRSRDRYRDHDSYRTGRRDRSRERRRSRDRDGLKDDRRRSRDRDIRPYRDDSRDRARRRRDEDEMADSRKKGRRDDSRERPHKPSTNGKQSEPIPTPEQIQAERQKKLEEWKKKQAAERERKEKEAQAAGGTRSLLAEIDKKAHGSPAAPSPGSPIAPIDENGAASPAPYAGPFDPKAIAKKVTGASTSSNKLGAFPMSATSGSKNVGLKANHPSASADGSTCKYLSSATQSTSVELTAGPAPASTPLKARGGNVSGFGLSSRINSEIEKASAKPGVVDFDEEEEGRRKLEKLPTPPPDTNDANEDTAMADIDDSDDDEDDDEDLQGTEEEIEARRLRLEEKREERLQAQEVSEEPSASIPNAIETNGDVNMKEASNEAMRDEVAEEEADPLDAFMAGIEDAPKRTKGVKAIKKAEAFFGDDEVELETQNPEEEFTVKKNKKKEIPSGVSGRGVSTPFRKAFYKPSSETASMTDEDILDLRHELGIKVKGDPPAPCVAWSSLGLSPATFEVIKRLGYEKPSAIQSQAIPAIMSGRDVLGIASTGSGKTLAFLIPLFRHVLDQRPLAGQDGPIALIMTPTRELASQISKEGRPFFKAQNLTAVTAVGGNPIKEDIAALARRCHLLVATPGRLLELCSTGRCRLQRVTYLVLDEADRMFDMGFEPQVSKVLSLCRIDQQCVLTSATFPRAMASLAAKVLKKPVEITVGGKSVVNSDITQVISLGPEETKFTRLLELLGKLYEKDENADHRCLVFVEKQEACDNLMVALLRKGYPCSTLHGGKDQVDRDSTIADFKAGVIPVLVATSVAARGLDVKQLKLVVNYDAPNHLEDYVHRIGRTGRSGEKGTGVTFLNPEQDRYAVGIARALRDSGVPIPDQVREMVESFNEKVKSGKEKASGSGFGGKGLERLDQERDAARARERKTHKTGDEPDEDENEEKARDDKGDDLITKAASSVQAASAPAPLAGVPKGIDLDGKIVVHKTEAPVSGSKLDKLDKVGQAVASIHDRLSKNKELRQGVPIDNKGPDAGAFHATLEINDFPQKARWAVTNRTNVAKILEATGTSITTKGSFYATGKEPGPGENAKLYILVEGDTEVVVTNAMRELMRLLKEGTIAAADSDARAPVGGRYNVV